jgi:hypothetical protein
VDGVNLDSKTSTLNRLLSWVDVYSHKPWKHNFSNIIYIIYIYKLVHYYETLRTKARTMKQKKWKLHSLNKYDELWKATLFMSTQNEGESKIIDEQNCKKINTTNYCKKNHKN